MTDATLRGPYTGSGQKIALLDFDGFQRSGNPADGPRHGGRRAHLTSTKSPAAVAGPVVPVPAKTYRK